MSDHAARSSTGSSLGVGGMNIVNTGVVASPGSDVSGSADDRQQRTLATATLGALTEHA